MCIGGIGLPVQTGFNHKDRSIKTGLFAVFSGLGLVQSWSFPVSVRSSLSLFPVLRLDLQTLRQFPVQLSFAMMINKAQGQSLKFVGIHLLSPVFCHGQLYVAFSRATSSQHIHVLLPKTSGNKTPNIVYPEILID